MLGTACSRPVNRRNSAEVKFDFHDSGQRYFWFKTKLLLRSRQGVNYCDEYVCLSVCPLALHENHMAELHQIFMHLADGSGSVLLWRRCDTLSTSGFVDDVMFSHNGPTARRV